MSSEIARAGLSKRQMEVLKLLGEGKTNAEIAKALFRSPNTIKLHVSAILRQLNLKKPHAGRAAGFEAAARGGGKSLLTRGVLQRQGRS